MILWVDAVLIDLAANVIRLRIPGFALPDASVGLLEVGSNGRLLGVEINETYVTVMESPLGQEPYVRTAVVAVNVSGDDPPWLTLPRRGPEYEITYPSGNQCWQTRTVGGQPIQVCATSGDARGEPAGDLACGEGSRS